MVSIVDKITYTQGAVESTVINSKNMKQTFFEYLDSNSNNKFSPKAIIACLDWVTDYAVRKNISDISLWEMADFNSLLAFFDKISKNKFLMVSNRKNALLYPKASSAYLSFIKSGADNNIFSQTIENTDKTEIQLETVEVTTAEINESKPRYTIIEAATEALKRAGRALCAKEIYDAIIADDLYSFGAKDPISVLRTELLRRCENVNMPSAVIYKKYLRISYTANGKNYYLPFISDIAKQVPIEINMQNQIPEDCASDICIYNWASPINLSGTKPASIKFNNHIAAIAVKTWKALLICVYDYITTNFPDTDIAGLSYGFSHRKLCSYNSAEVSYAVKLNCGLYIDSAWSANDIIELTKAIFAFCKKDVYEIEISYRKNRVDSILANIEAAVVKRQELTKEEENILLAFKLAFPMSMNIGFADLTKLKVAYEKQCDVIITLSDADVYSLIKEEAIKTANNRYTHIDNLVSPDTLAEINLFIENEFAKSDLNCRIYAKPLYEKFKSNLSVAVNEDLLLTIIEVAFGNIYKINRKSMFITTHDNNNFISVNEEISAAIVKLLHEDVQPFNVDVISQKMPSYPKNKIAAILSNEHPEIVSVSGDMYAHADYVYIEDDDVQKIKSLISESIAIAGYMAINDLMNAISGNVPDVIEMNPEISQKDIIKIIKQKLSGNFKYKKDWQNGDRFLPKEGV